MAVFVTFVRVVRPLLLRLAGALPEPLVAMPARATFSYKKRKGRREYVRVALRAAADGVIEAVKYEQDGAGVLTSLTETDGLAELDEDVTKGRAGRDGRLSVLRVARRLMSHVWILRRKRFGARRVFRRVDVEERIDRLGRPIGDGDAVPRRPDFDLAQVLVDQRAPQILAQRDRPQRRRPDGAIRPSARRPAACRPRRAPRAGAPPDLSAGTDNRPAR